MSKSNASQRLPRAKGIDMANLYSPKECTRKAKHLILSEVNQRIVKEFIEILGMREEFEQHGVPVPNKIVMYGLPGTGKTLTAFTWLRSLSFHLSWFAWTRSFTVIWGKPEAISVKYSIMPARSRVSCLWTNSMP